MKKLITVLLAFFMTVGLVFSGGIPVVHAATGSSSSGYNDYPQQTNVSPNKIWSITFNKAVNISAASSSITVYDSDNNVFPVSVSVSGTGGNIVMVAPSRSYDLGKTYSLIIKASLYDSASSQHLKNDVRMLFTIKSKPDPSDYPSGSSGIPNNNGLIIAKDSITQSIRAYDLGYLYSNSNAISTIKNNSSGSIYYIPGSSTSYSSYVLQYFPNITTYTNLSSLVGTINSAPIIYTDASGSNYTYTWNSTSSTYIGVNPPTSSISNSAGIPNDSGLIMVQNSDPAKGSVQDIMAYSVSYLYSNPNVVSNIKSTSNTIYYVSGLSNAYSLFVSQNFNSTSTYTSIYSIIGMLGYKPVIYVDGSGYNYTYNWTSSSSSYTAQNPPSGGSTNNGGSGGIPNDTGIIIVENDNSSGIPQSIRAYSVQYLYNNSNISNDIKSGANNKVYYVPSLTNPYYSYVQETFGNAINSSYTMIYVLGLLGYKPIVYTDSLGNNYTYAYDATTGTYKLQSPSISVDVNLNSSTMNVSLTVRNAIAVPGATYFKLDGSNIVKKINSAFTSADVSGVDDTVNFVSMQPQQKIYVLSSNQSVLASGYIDASKKCTNTIFPVTLEATQPGNTSGNSNNNGSAVQGDDGYTYYLNSGDNDTIYKTDNTGNYNMQIGLDRAQYMNISNGWVYYSNYNDAGKIYRIRTDGTQRQKICDDTAAYVVVYGDWIYYSNHSDEGKIYKIGISGVNGDASTYTIAVDKTVHGLIVDNMSSSKNIPYDETAYLNVVDGWIYYINNSDDHTIYKIDVDGNFRTKVNDEWSTCPQVVGDYVYYCANTGEIKKVDSSGNSEPIDMNAQDSLSDEDQSFHINVSGDWIYYSNKLDNKMLYKVRTDGSGEKYKLTNMPIDYVNVVGDKLYIVANKIVYTLPVDTTGGDTPIPVSKGTPDDSVVKVNDITKIVDYNDVNRPIEWLEEKYLPDKVSVFTEKDLIQELTVSWDKVNKTFSNGIYTYTGTIVGYDKTVKLYLIIPSEMLNDTNDIIVTNNPGQGTDTIQIYNDIHSTSSTGVKLKPGDVIRVYGDEGRTRLLGKPATVGSDSKVTIKGLDLDSNGYAFYLSVQRSGKYESDLTRIAQMGYPSIAANGAEDDDNVYLGATGNDITVKPWTEARWDDGNRSTDTNNGYDSVYVVPSGTSLDMSSASVKPLNVKDSLSVENPKIPVGSVTAPITLDNTIINDSLNKPLAGGNYDVYVARTYDTPPDDETDTTQLDSYVKADPDGRRPHVTGQIASITSASLTITSEGVPSKPVITGPAQPNPVKPVQTMVKDGDAITLQNPLKLNEEIWFVPTNNTLAVTTVSRWLAQSHLSDGNNNMDNFFQTIGGPNGIVRAFGNVVQNNLLVGPGNDIKLEDGVAYTVFVMNDVGASIAADKQIVADYTAPARPTSNKATYTLGTDNLITVGGIGENAIIYLVPGTLTDQDDLSSYILAATRSVAVKANQSGTMNISTLLTTGQYSLFAVDTAGNIGKPINITINPAPTPTPTPTP